MVYDSREDELDMLYSADYNPQRMNLDEIRNRVQRGLGQYNGIRKCLGVCLNDGTIIDFDELVVRKF